jgi:hypothetical protein
MPEPAARILDVGCFDERFLEPLTSQFVTFGTEIQPNARKRAQARGITIVGLDWKELSEHEGFGGKKARRHPELVEPPVGWGWANDHMLVVWCKK